MGRFLAGHGGNGLRCSPAFARHEGGVEVMGAQNGNVA